MIKPRPGGILVKRRTGSGQIVTVQIPVEVKGKPALPVGESVGRTPPPAAVTETSSIETTSASDAALRLAVERARASPPQVPACSGGFRMPVPHPPPTEAQRAGMDAKHNADLGWRLAKIVGVEFDLMPDLLKRKAVEVLPNGIHAAVVEAAIKAGSTATEKELQHTVREAMRAYFSRVRYLEVLTAPGAVRPAFAGRPGQAISEAERAAAQRKLDERRKKWAQSATNIEIAPIFAAIRPKLKLTEEMIGTLGPGSHCDGRGLMLVAKPSGTRSWVLRYQLKGRRRDAGLGPWPEVTLARAREKALELRRAIKDEGRDPLRPKPKPESIKRMARAKRQHEREQAMPVTADNWLTQMKLH
jgi:hypothetical protein